MELRSDDAIKAEPSPSTLYSTSTTRLVGKTVHHTLTVRNPGTETRVSLSLAIRIPFGAQHTTTDYGSGSLWKARSFWMPSRRPAVWQVLLYQWKNQRRPISVDDLFANGSDCAVGLGAGPAVRAGF